MYKIKRRKMITKFINDNLDREYMSVSEVYLAILKGDYILKYCMGIITHVVNTACCNETGIDMQPLEMKYLNDIICDSYNILKQMEDQLTGWTTELSSGIYKAITSISLDNDNLEQLKKCYSKIETTSNTLKSIATEHNNNLLCHSCLPVGIDGIYELIKLNKSMLCRYGAYAFKDNLKKLSDNNSRIGESVDPLYKFHDSIEEFDAYISESDDAMKEYSKLMLKFPSRDIRDQIFNDRISRTWLSYAGVDITELADTSDFLLESVLLAYRKELI